MQTTTCAGGPQFINRFFLNNPAETAAALLPVLRQHWRASSDYQSWLPPPRLLSRTSIHSGEGLDADPGGRLRQRGEGGGGGGWRCRGAAADFIIPRTGIFCSAALMAPAPPPNNLLFLRPLFSLAINWPKSSKVMRAPRAPPALATCSLGVFRSHQLSSVAVKVTL